MFYNVECFTAEEKCSRNSLCTALVEQSKKKAASILQIVGKGCNNAMMLLDKLLRERSRLQEFCWSLRKLYSLVVPCLFFSTLSVGIPIKIGHVFVCAQHPAFGRSEGGGPAENSFANRWELVAPLA